MTKLKVVLFIAAALLVAGCTQQSAQESTSISANPPVAQEASASEVVVTEETTDEVAATECPGDEINPIGESIAADYDFASYDQVMTWFCDGAEFEDILVALETQGLTGEPAEDMLQMLADGLTWDDIWLLVGLDS